MIYYKVLNQDGSCIYGNGKWSLPENGEPGAWMPLIKGKLAPCENGYPVCDRDMLVHWSGPTISLAETRGEVRRMDNKILCRQARLLRSIFLETWTPRTRRLFAADCAEHVVHFFEEMRPGDKRARLAIEAARQFANERIWTVSVAAAGKAVQEAARDDKPTAAWDAARSAARAAARSAVGSAARGAAWDVAFDAERSWQTERLFACLEGRIQ